jgi:hypothetical protein
MPLLEPVTKAILSFSFPMVISRIELSAFNYQLSGKKEKAEREKSRSVEILMSRCPMRLLPPFGERESEPFPVRYTHFFVVVRRESEGE